MLGYDRYHAELEAATDRLADVAVRGSARELLLVLHRRTAPEQAAGLEVFGDRELFYHWLAHSAFQ